MSQPNLAEQANTGGAEPQLQAQPALPTQKQKTDVYTVMLIISLICLVLACGLLFFELRRWGSFPGRPWGTNEARPNVRAVDVDDHLTLRV